MNSLYQFAFSKRLLIPFCILFVVLSGIARAQEKPPRPIGVTANTLQGLQFGAFCTGAIGGTVTVTSGGGRSSGGSVILVTQSTSYSPAMFTVNGNVGTLVTIVNGSDVSITGSNGGSVSLHLESASTGTPFIINSVAGVTVLIGGTLTVGGPGANPPGVYSGSFNVTFIQQ